MSSEYAVESGNPEEIRIHAYPPLLNQMRLGKQKRRPKNWIAFPADSIDLEGGPKPMRNTFLTAVGIAALMVVGCATPSVIIREPVGPDPFAATDSGRNGKLQVFAEWTEQNPGGLPKIITYPNYARTIFMLVDDDGRVLLDTAHNGQPNPSGQVVVLAPGTYRLKAAQAGKGGSSRWTEFPVVIEPGRITEAYLNGGWMPPANTPNTQLVYSPDGFAVGWRARALPKG